MPSHDALAGPNTGLAHRVDEVVLVAAYTSNANRALVEVQLDELEELARTLETTVVERSLVRLREPNPATLLGRGAVAELGALIAGAGHPAVLMNDSLTPRQQRNLEEEWGVTVLDRTEVILAIFGRRATSAEGRLQVEMAQLEHLLPRIAGKWSHLERQRGGIGLRGGPGETQIEVDRRLINQRLKRLRQRLAVVRRQRQTRRAARTAVPLATCALVGYTNAGKSTLLNKLTSSEVLADNKLFATLDPTSRRLELSSGRRMILTDTVGFIQALPTELVEAFAATLEEVREAHMLAIVVDASHPDSREQLTTVLETLESMECEQQCLLVAAKCDLIDPADIDSRVAPLEEIVGSGALRVSSTKGAGLREFKDALDRLAGTLVAETKANRPSGISHALPPDEADAGRAAG